MKDNVVRDNGRPDLGGGQSRVDTRRLDHDAWIDRAMVRCVARVDCVALCCVTLCCGALCCIVLRGA